MNPFADIRSLVVKNLEAMADEGRIPRGLPLAAVAVEPPRDPAHGDMATNAAMALAKPAGRSPREIAAELAPRLAADDRVESAEIAGPGFINLRLDAAVWWAVVGEALERGENFGRSEMGMRRRVDVEYVSTNPTGPLHVGHTRGAVFGDALASLLEFTGHEVTREYYVNDGGAQVDALARSVYLRYLQAAGRDVSMGEVEYPGDYLVAVGRALHDRIGDAFVDTGEQLWLEEVRAFATEAMMELIRGDLAALGIEMDRYFSERSLYDTGRIEAAVDVLEERGLIYEGTLEPPKGKTPEDWEPRRQTLFRSTAHGDDVDRPIRKSDGSWTYFAPDIAYHHDKIRRGFDELIDVFGADHGGYVKRMTAAVSALSDGQVPLEIHLMQIVRLLRAGEPVQMSKRAGTFVTLRELLDEVGPGVVRFVMLTRRADAPLDFDLARALEQSRDNPVFYVQYANARVHSVMRRAGGEGISTSTETLRGADLASLSDEAEIGVARKIAEWPRLVEIAARAREPHRVAFYLYELASEFHALWNRGNDDPSLRFVQQDEAASAPKLALARAVSAVIEAGLGILGVEPMEEMR